MKKDDFFKRLKIAGMVSFIPVILAAGPLAGYILGDYLVKKWGWSFYSSLICIGAGLLASIFEVARIIRLVVKISKDS